MEFSAECIRRFYKKLWASLIVFIVLVVILKPLMSFMFPVPYREEISKYSSAYGVDEHLVMAIISAESKFDKDAVSHKGAKGLMQIRDKTAAWCMEQFKIDGNVYDLHNPDLNINIGCAYISYLAQKFGEDINTILAAYNAGEGNVKKWIANTGGVNYENIPFKETKNYVKKVKERKNIYSFLY